MVEHTTTRTGPAARQRVLDTAARLFAQRGVRAVGVDTIIAGSGVAKATFYRHFPSKDELVVAVLDRADAEWLARLSEAAQAAGGDPRDQLVAAFEALVDECARPEFHGCLFLGTAAQSDPGSGAHQRARRHKDAVHDWLCELARRAWATDPEELARQLALLLDGALAGGFLEADPRAARAAREAARVLVAAGCP
ncbi:MAG: TetR/AcrR family transcriptional regulator [Thermoleophilia bacterium]